jgi:hypothetical protein
MSRRDKIGLKTPANDGVQLWGPTFGSLNPVASSPKCPDHLDGDSDGQRRMRFSVRGESQEDDCRKQEGIERVK